MQAFREKEIILSEVRQMEIMLEPYLKEVSKIHGLSEVAYALHDMLDNDMYTAMVATITHFETMTVDTSIFDFAEEIVKAGRGDREYRERVREDARSFIDGIKTPDKKYERHLCAVLLHLRLLEKTNNGEKKECGK